jgi:hypothetical protein
MTALFGGRTYEPERVDKALRTRRCRRRFHTTTPNKTRARVQPNQIERLIEGACDFETHSASNQQPRSFRFISLQHTGKGHVRFGPQRTLSLFFEHAPITPASSLRRRPVVVVPPGAEGVAR